jgi:hypothetical protein
MPRGDGTGPAGMGPMTGRTAGFCAGYPVAGYANQAGGRGYGCGFGRGGGRGGRGYRNRFYAAGLTGWQRAEYGMAVPYAAPYAGVPSVPTKEQQTDMLKNQARYLEEQLGAVQERIAGLEAEKK